MVSVHDAAWAALDVTARGAEGTCCSTALRARWGARAESFAPRSVIKLKMVEGRASSAALSGDWEARASRRRG